MIKDAASFNVALRLSIPLGHYDHRSVRTFPIPGPGREVTRARHIIFDRGRVHGAGPGQLIAIKIEVVDSRQRIKLIAVAQRVFSVTAKHIARVVTVDMIDDKGQPPLKRAHYAVIVAVVISALAPVHVIFPGNQIYLFNEGSG